jgi:endonuclease/exonuclease/phosphatase family metal-dependent hydrolase
MEPLKILTLNIRGKDVSHWAQRGFTRERKFKLIAALVRSHRPHVVTLQEVSDDLVKLMRAEMLKRGYAELCSVPSPHPPPSKSGGTFIYVEDGPMDAAGLPEVGPVALARIRQPRTDNSTVDVFLAACHLRHGSMERETRRNQLAAALEALPQGCLVVVAGDTNLRGKAEDYLGGLPLHLALTAAILCALAG